MTTSHGTVIFFCGKMGAGKSTLATQMAQTRGAVLLSEDEWLAALFPGNIQNFQDYLRYAERLKPPLSQHITQILAAGTTVILDFPGNTVRQRAWFQSLYAPSGFPHELYYVVADDALCLQQLQQRQKEQPERAAFDTEAVFRQVTAYFEPPTAAEGFNVIRVERN